MQDPVVAFIKSLLKTVAVAVVIGLTAFFTHQSFLFWFIVAFVGQYVLFYALNTLVEYRAMRDARILKLRESELVGPNTIKVACANCKKESEVIIRTDRDNRFTCGFCTTKNAVYLSAETAVVTDPLYEKDVAPLKPNISNE